jgi:hypothetical protein
VALFVAALILRRMGQFTETGPVQETSIRERIKPQLDERLAEGRAAMERGLFQSAAEDLEVALRIRSEHPLLLNWPAYRELTQLHLQAALLADRLPESLEAMLRRLSFQDNREAQALFQRHYRGKGVIFHATVRRDAAGRYHTDYRQSAGDPRAQLALGDLQLFASLPLSAPQQLLFGARLESAKPQATGEWRIGFQPESAVLFTFAQAAKACFTRPPPDKELEALLDRQAGWLAEIP